MNVYQYAIALLFALAISDLIVGVSNDAVNFLNSSIGARVSSRRVILAVASLGILAGVTFSSGMMEVARKGIFHPQFFTMPELMVIFVAVMLTDIILLDLYNTFGFPTSTTVSIVFELLGAAVAVSLWKLHQAGADYRGVVDYINTGKALAIIFGILLSVVVAFVAGASIQFLTRVLFTFDFEKRIRKYGALWGGLALASITYFILIKGAKGASFITPETVTWIKQHTLLILFLAFVGSAALLQSLLMFTRVTILKVIVLVGTFALAMAFAANDLVNFVGVPLAGLSAYGVASGSGDLLGLTMDALRQPVRSSTLFLLIAGGVMVATLWVSRKARTVTRTEVSLGRQDEGFERFESTWLSQTIVRFVASLLTGATRAVPSALRQGIGRRLDSSHYRPTPAADGNVPSFDLVRAAVNVMVASALISLATSMKLPLSTTYVTFMVAMGTSLSDQAWGRDSAVFRVTGVLTVIGGWFFTAMMAFCVSWVFATAIYFGRAPIAVGIAALAVFLITRTHLIHRRRERAHRDVEIFNLKKITDSVAAIDVTFEHAGKFLGEVARVYDDGSQGLFLYDRARLRRARAGQRQIQIWANVIVANIFKILRLLQWEAVTKSRRYSQTISALQEISESLRDIVMRAQLHVDNQHAGLLERQVEEMDRLRREVDDILHHASRILLRRAPLDPEAVTAWNRRLETMADEFDLNQIARIQDASSKTRLSILFYSYVWDSLKIAQQATSLLVMFEQSLLPERVADERGPQPGGVAQRAMAPPE